MALIASDLTPEWIYPQSATETNVDPLAGRKNDVTAWPSDAARPPFAVGGVYRFTDVWGRERTALVYTGQQARVDGGWWNISELPEDAAFVGTFTPDPALTADAYRFAREVINSERWS